MMLEVIEACAAEIGGHYWVENAARWPSEDETEPFYTGAIEVEEVKFHTNSTVTLIGWADWTTVGYVDRPNGSRDTTAIRSRLVLELQRFDGIRCVRDRFVIPELDLP